MLLGIFAKNQVSASTLTTPVVLVFMMIPMFTGFSETLQKISMFFFTGIAFDAIANISNGLPAVDIKGIAVLADSRGDHMEIILSNASDRPIYEQITSQIKEMIMKGTLKPGEPMPSMRKLAKDLHVSVITTQRAYDDLSRDGFIVTVPARTCGGSRNCSPTPRLSDAKTD